MRTKRERERDEKQGQPDSTREREREKKRKNTKTKRLSKSLLQDNHIETQALGERIRGWMDRMRPDKECTYSIFLEFEQCVT